jgi:uncharacterized protein
MIDLLDVNVWIALVDRRHVHHQEALKYWDNSKAESVAFCRLTMLGFLRLTTSSRATPNALTLNEAWHIYHQFRALPNIHFLEESLDLENSFHALTTQKALPHHLWTDAYLAAFAMTHGCRIVSFDSDFKRFVDLDYLHLKS